MSSVATKVEEVDAIVVCGDLAGFTVVIPLTSQQHVELLAQFRTVVHCAVENAGGEILRWVGNAMYAVWPIPQTEEEKKKIGTGLVSLLDAISRFQLPGNVACKPIVGVAAGRIIRAEIAILGHKYSTEIMGSVVNLASRLSAGCNHFKTTILFLENLPVIWPKNYESVKINDIVIKGQPDENHTVFTLRQAGSG